MGKHVMIPGEHADAHCGTIKHADKVDLDVAEDADRTSSGCSEEDGE